MQKEGRIVGDRSSIIDHRWRLLALEVVGWAADSNDNGGGAVATMVVVVVVAVAVMAMNGGSEW